MTQVKFTMKVATISGHGVMWRCLTTFPEAPREGDFVELWSGGPKARINVRIWSLHQPEVHIILPTQLIAGDSDHEKNLRSAGWVMQNDPA